MVPLLALAACEELEIENGERIGDCIGSTSDYLVPVIDSVPAGLVSAP